MAVLDKFRNSRNWPGMHTVVCTPTRLTSKFSLSCPAAHRRLRTCRTTLAPPGPFPVRSVTTVPPSPLAFFVFTITDQILSGRLGFTYNITVVNSSVSPDRVIASVADGTFDMVASWITINSIRMDSVSFSYPYFDNDISFVYRVDVVNEVCVTAMSLYVSYISGAT